MADSVRTAAVHRRPMVAAAAFFALATLAGCGFHMQGASPLPEGIRAVHVTYSSRYTVGDPPVVTELRQRLRRQHLLGGSDAPARLDIVSVSNTGRNVSVSPVNGKVAEKSLTSQVVFDYSVGGERKLTNTSLSETRYYSYSDLQRLSMSGEYDKLVGDMQRDLANRILERVAMASAENRQQADKQD